MPRQSPKPKAVRVVASLPPCKVGTGLLALNLTALLQNLMIAGRVQEPEARAIITACNSHAALVQALEACKKYMDDPKGSDVTGQQALGAINYALSLLAGQEE